MKLMLSFLFCVYASLDDKGIGDHPLPKPHQLITFFFMIAGYLCAYLDLFHWYTADEITRISLYFMLLYHLHPSTHKFDFLHDMKNVPEFLLISINDFGFGMLGHLQQIPLSTLLCLKAVVFPVSFSGQCIHSKWFSILMIVLMLTMI